MEINGVFCENIVLLFMQKEFDLQSNWLRTAGRKERNKEKKTRNKSVNSYKEILMVFYINMYISFK